MTLQSSAPPQPLLAQRVAIVSLFVLLVAGTEAAAGERIVAADRARADADSGLLWYDLRLLDVEGQGWTDTLAPYDRLPREAESTVRPALWNLSRHSAGICARFVTDAPEIHVSWTLTNERLAMPHMPATGVSGVDLYARSDQGEWRWLAVGRPDGTKNTARLASGIAVGRREYLMYLPLYNGVSSVEIGIPRDKALARAEPRASTHRRPLVFYGTSITHGACASRPGMPHPAILGRWFERPVINLGFSGNGKMEPEVTVLLAELDAAVYIIDCLPNMNAAEVSARTGPLVRGLRAVRPATPILLVEDRNYTNSFLLETQRERNRTNQDALKHAYWELRDAGVRGLYYLDGEKLLGADGEDTVDSSHPSDLGFMRQAEAFRTALEPILQRETGTRGSASANSTSGGTTVRVAAISFVPEKYNLQGNTDRLEQAFRDAAAGGAKIAVAPEGVLEGYVVDGIVAGEVPEEEMKKVAVEIDGPVIKRFQALAKELEMSLAFGFAERIDGDVFNCAVFIDDQGRVRGKYHKMQLAEGYHPSWWFNRLGRQSRAFDTPYGRCGFLICNDRWNPQLARIPVLDGARFLIIPSFGSRSKNQDDAVLGRGRENGVPVIEANVGVTLIVDQDEIAAVDRSEVAITYGSITIPESVDPQPLERDRIEGEFLDWRRREMKRRFMRRMQRVAQKRFGGIANVGVEKQEFVDDTLIHQMSGASRTTDAAGGFVAIETGRSQGTIVTKALTTSGQKLYIDVDARGGSISVELLGANGKTLKGFEHSAAQPMTGDGLQRVEWTRGARLANLAELPIVMKFYMKQCKLRGFEFR